MLPWEVFDHGIQPVTFGFDLDSGFLNAHFVFRADRYGRILFAEFEQDQAAIWPQGGPESPEHRPRVGKLMVDVREQRQVNRSVGQLRIRGLPENGSHIFQFSTLYPRFDEPDHARLYIDGVDSARGSGGARKQLRVVPGAGADIGDHHAGFYLQQAYGETGPLFVFPFGPLQPWGAANAHYSGVRPAAEWMFPGILPGEPPAEGEQQEQQLQTASHFDKVNR